MNREFKGVLISIIASIIGGLILKIILGINIAYMIILVIIVIEILIILIILLSLFSKKKSEKHEITTDNGISKRDMKAEAEEPNLQTHQEQGDNNNRNLPETKGNKRENINKIQSEVYDDFKIIDKKNDVVSTDDHYIHGVGCRKGWTVFLINELQYGTHKDIMTYYLQMKSRKILSNGSWKIKAQLTSDKPRNIYAIAIPKAKTKKLLDGENSIFKKIDTGNYNIKYKNYSLLKMDINIAVDNDIDSDGPVKRRREEESLVIENEKATNKDKNIQNQVEIHKPTLGFSGKPPKDLVTGYRFNFQIDNVSDEDIDEFAFTVLIPKECEFNEHNSEVIKIPSTLSKFYSSEDSVRRLIFESKLKRLQPFTCNFHINMGPRRVKTLQFCVFATGTNLSIKPYYIRFEKFSFDSEDFIFKEVEREKQLFITYLEE